MAKEIKSSKSLQQFFVPVLVVVAVGLAFFSGTLWQRVKNLEGGSTTGAQKQAVVKPGIGNDKTQSDKVADFLKSVVDAKTLKSCIDSGKYDVRLTSDQEIATSLEVEGTPGFFVNNIFYGGAYSWDSNISDPTTKAAIQNSSMKAIAEGAKIKSNSTIALATIKQLWSKDIIKFGDGNSNTLFVIVSDPSCPYCQIASGLNKSLIQGFDNSGKYLAPVPQMKAMVEAGQASLVYIYQNGHGKGEMGMKALYCANEQGKFWQAENLIMSDDGYILMNGG